MLAALVDRDDDAYEASLCAVMTMIGDLTSVNKNDAVIFTVERFDQDGGTVHPDSDESKGELMFRPRNNL